MCIKYEPGRVTILGEFSKFIYHLRDEYEKENYTVIGYFTYA